MDKRKKIIIFLFVLVLLVGFVVFYTSKTNFTSVINRNIYNAAKTSQYLNLSDITPFDWDKAFIIEDPYIGGEALDKVIGVKCNLKASDVDLIRRIVFIKDNKFIYDYKYKLTDLSFSPFGKIVDKKNCLFSIEKSSSKRLLLKASD